MRTAIPLTVLATALACSLGTEPANARARVFVASYGSDSNPCTFGSPCKTFQVAVNAVDAGGEVTAIDSAGFGPISINKSVTITSPVGVEAGIVPASGSDAIDINAGPNDNIVLRGLSLNGSGTAPNGILFKAGASLTIINCVFQNFVNDGVLMLPISGAINFVIKDTILSNVGVGINYFPPSGSTATAKIVIEHVVATNNQFGFAIQPYNGGGATNAVITNSLSSENSSDGIYINNGANLSSLAVSIDNSIFSDNTFNGISASGTSTVKLGRSVMNDNGVFGICNQTNPNTFYTYKDNRVNGNLNDFCFGGSPLNTTFALQ
jgi:hypothetical protein